MANKNFTPPASVIYSKKIRKKIWLSTICYIRDCIIFWLPLTRLPNGIRKMLYGDISYIFFIHPRRKEDYYLGLPLINCFFNFLPQKVVALITQKLPPALISEIKNKNNKGVIVSSLMLPETLLEHRHIAFKKAIQSILFCRKISNGRCIIGLGAWWPIITQRGSALQQKFDTNDVIITSGHTGTLVSIYSMIKKISVISNIKLSELNIIIIGAGKMGANVANILNDKINKLTLCDINMKTMENTINNLKMKKSKTQINAYLKNEMDSLYGILNQHHITVCVTSNLNVVINEADIPDYMIFIDDSRPEAISRKCAQDKCIILEGGLMKLTDTKTNYDYGFGIDNNVFGCLAEAYILSIDNEGIIKPTLGDVDFENAERMTAFCDENNIVVGDFKTADQLIPESKIINFIHKRSEIFKREQMAT